MSTKKIFHKSEEKMHTKMKMTLQRAENLVQVQQHHGTCVCDVTQTIMVNHFTKKNLLILLFIADMAIQMCNFDNFDIGQMSPKFAQR